MILSNHYLVCLLSEVQGRKAAPTNPELTHYRQHIPPKEEKTGNNLGHCT